MKNRQPTGKIKFSRPNIFQRILYWLGIKKDPRFDRKYLSTYLYDEAPTWMPKEHFDAKFCESGWDIKFPDYSSKEFCVFNVKDLDVFDDPELINSAEEKSAMAYDKLRHETDCAMLGIDPYPKSNKKWKELENANLDEKLKIWKQKN